MYDQEKVALVATIVEGHLRPSEFLTAIMDKLLVVEPTHMSIQRNQAAREVALANGNAVSCRLHSMVDQVMGSSLWGEFSITFTRTSLKKQWVKRVGLALFKTQAAWTHMHTHTHTPTHGRTCACARGRLPTCTL